MSMQRPRKPQDRTAITRQSLLQAAETVFARVGYESAQVDEIAEAAGFSKGALYAHFKSKEELFLALATTKGAGYQAKLREALDAAATRKAKIAVFRRFYVDLSKERAWALIILEVKLFMVRYPAAKERILKVEQQVGDGVSAALVEMFGASARASGEALGGIFSALVLEADLAPNVITGRKMRAMLGTVFDALMKTGTSDH